MSRNWMALALAGVMTAAAGCGGAGGSKPASSDRKQGVPGSTYKVVLRGENAYWDASTSSTVILPSGGVVTSNVGGMSCGVDGGGALHTVCSFDAANATTVVLTATANTAGWVHGWAGACGGTADTCPVFVSSDRLAVIRFAATTTALGAHANFSDPAVHVVEVMKFGQPNSYRCTDCHGATLQGMGIAPACTVCHPTTPVYPPGFVHAVDGTFGSPAAHGPAWISKSATCAGCHGPTLAGNSFTPGCNKCHPMPHVPGTKAPPNHDDLYGASLTDCALCHEAASPTRLAPSCTSCHSMTHPPTFPTHGLAYVANTDQCRYCHSTPQSATGALNGGLTAPSCAAAGCHSAEGTMPHVLPYFDPAVHGTAYVTSPSDACKGCHGPDLGGATPPLAAPSCTKCHAIPHDVHAMDPPKHDDPGAPLTDCATCHDPVVPSPTRLAPSCTSCHTMTHAPTYLTHGLDYVTNADQCRYCHSTPQSLSGLLNGGITAPYCGSVNCHSAAGTMPHAISFADPAAHGAAYLANPLDCKGCHGPSLGGATPPLVAPSCSSATAFRTPPA